MEVWFNPSCSKCRIARDQLDEAGVEYTLRRYLDDPPTEPELRAALAREAADRAGAALAREAAALKTAVRSAETGAG